MMRKSLKKGLAVSMAFSMLAMAVTGCSSGSTAAPKETAAKEEAAKTEAAKEGEAKAEEAAGAEDWKWERKVTLVCPWGVGGWAFRLRSST